jgi:hypothetical protein
LDPPQLLVELTVCCCETLSERDQAAFSSPSLPLTARCLMTAMDRRYLRTDTRIPALTGRRNASQNRQVQARVDLDLHLHQRSMAPIPAACHGHCAAYVTRPICEHIETSSFTSCGSVKRRFLGPGLPFGVRADANRFHVDGHAGEMRTRHCIPLEWDILSAGIPEGKPASLVTCTKRTSELETWLLWRTRRLRGHQTWPTLQSLHLHPVLTRSVNTFNMLAGSGILVSFRLLLRVGTP